MNTNQWLIILVAGLFVAVMGGTPAPEPLQFSDASSDAVFSRSFIDYGSDYLGELRIEYGVDQLIAGAECDLDRVAAVCTWVHGLWEHDGSNQPRKGDPLSILDAAKHGERFRCVEYATVIVGSLQSVGIPARSLGLKTADVQTRTAGAGHVVAEAYLRDEEKWVYVDGQWNAIPVLDGRPLNAVELQAALAQENKALTFIGLTQKEYAGYAHWVARYLYYFDYGIGNGQELMLGPIDAPKPTVFQRVTPLGDLVYIHSPRTFYTKPML